jgi:hypothetical protein
MEEKTGLGRSEDGEERRGYRYNVDFKLEKTWVV